jgi:hypothetical protein
VPALVAPTSDLDSMTLPRNTEARKFDTDHILRHYTNISKKQQQPHRTSEFKKEMKHTNFL